MLEPEVIEKSEKVINENTPTLGKEKVISQFSAIKWVLQEKKELISRNILKRLFFRNKLKEIDYEVHFIDFIIKIYTIKDWLDSGKITLSEYFEYTECEEYVYLKEGGFPNLQFYFGNPYKMEVDLFNRRQG